MEPRIETSVYVRNGPGSPLGGVTLAGYIRNSRGVIARPMRILGRYALVYLLAGSGLYRDETGLYQTVQAGDLLLIFPHLAHYYGPEAGMRWDEFYMVFEGPVFDLWYVSGLLDPAHPIYHLEPIDEWLNRFSATIPASATTFVPPLHAVCRLQLVLDDIVSGRTMDGGRSDRDGEIAWATAACGLLQEGTDASAQVRITAAALDLSYDRFRKRFRQIVGMSPARYRSTRVIDRACEMMQQGAETDREIAETLGFCDEFYFSRRFKQITGRSPRTYRQSLSGCGDEGI